MDREIKRWGIDLDAIREGTSATATQIRLEAEAQSEFVQMIIDTNTQFFEFIHVATMALFRKYVSRSNKVKIPVNVEMEKLRMEGGEIIGIEKDAMGIPIKETYKAVTAGDISRILNEKKFRVEISTKTGVIEKDTLKTARWSEMAQFAPANPLLLRAVVTNMANASGLKLSDDIWGQPPQQPGMPGQQGQPAETVQQPNAPQNIPQQVLPLMQ